MAIPLLVLCELVWVLRRLYRFGASDCIGAIQALLAPPVVHHIWCAEGRFQPAFLHTPE